MNATLLLAQDSVQSDFLNRIDGDALAAATIILVAGSVAIAIVMTICITVTVQRVYAIRESNKLIMELVKRGFSADEIENITYGNSGLGKKVGKIFRDARNAFKTQHDHQAHGSAVPPVKSA